VKESPVPSFVSDPVAGAFNANWMPKTAAIDGVDLTFIYNCLLADKAEQVVEIGCCTGLSTALMAMMMDEISPGRIASYDILDHVYWDPSLPVGFMIEKVAPDRQTKVVLRIGKGSVDVAADFAPGSIDLCFIDAGHAHPWPTIDTLCLLPFLRPGAIIVHHDLQLYRSRTNHAGTGPKMLYDQLLPRERMTVDSVIGPQLDSRLKMRAQHIRRNIFAFRRDENLKSQANRIAQGLYLPWLVPSPIPSDLIERAMQLWAEHLGDEVVTAMSIGTTRSMVTNGWRSGPALPESA
jgi:hypothetical protein